MENVTVRGHAPPAMDDSAEAITGKVRALRKRAGLTLESFAKAMGYRGASSVQRYENPNDYPGGYLSRELVSKMEKVLVRRGTPPVSREDVWELAGPEFLTIARKEPVNATIHGKTTGPGARIALYGQAVGGLDGEFVMNEGNKLADITAPPALANVSDAYAVSCSGDSMEPRYFDGEVCYVHPKRRPIRGDFVVAQIHNPNEGSPPLAYIKRLVRFNEGGLVLEQFNPPKELRFERDQVVSVHVIVASGDRLLENW